MGKFLDKAGLQHYDEKIKAYVDSKSGGVNTNLTSHIGNKKNPHGVTKEQVGLGNVTNEAQIPLSQKGVASGVATLGTDGKLAAGQLPAMKTVNGVSVVGSGNISIDLSLYKVVDTLPTTGIDATKIYIVPAQTTGDKNIKVEYVYTGDPTSTYDASKWEKLGEAQTNIVVDAYLSDTSINPVQNRTLKIAIDNLNNSVTGINGTLGELSSRISKASIDNTRQDTAIAGKLDKTDYVVDADLSETSTNPVQNKILYQYFNFITTTLDEEFDKKLNKTDYVVDSALNRQSKNPVQNKVLMDTFDSMYINLNSLINTAIGNLTKASVGLGNVDNTSDADKPVSTAVKTELDSIKDNIKSQGEAISEMQIKLNQLSPNQIIYGVERTRKASDPNFTTFINEAYKDTMPLHNNNFKPCLIKAQGDDNDEVAKVIAWLNPTKPWLDIYGNSVEDAFTTGIHNGVEVDFATYCMGLWILRGGTDANYERYIIGNTYFKYGNDEAIYYKGFYRSSDICTLIDNKLRCFQSNTISGSAAGATYGQTGYARTNLTRYQYETYGNNKNGANSKVFKNSLITDAEYLDAMMVIEFGSFNFMGIFGMTSTPSPANSWDKYNYFCPIVKLMAPQVELAKLLAGNSVIDVYATYDNADGELSNIQLFSDAEKSETITGAAKTIYKDLESDYQFGWSSGKFVVLDQFHTAPNSGTINTLTPAQVVSSSAKTFDQNLTGKAMFTITYQPSSGNPIITNFPMMVYHGITNITKHIINYMSGIELFANEDNTFSMYIQRDADKVKIGGDDSDLSAATDYDVVFENKSFSPTGYTIELAQNIENGDPTSTIWGTTVGGGLTTGQCAYVQRASHSSKRLSVILGGSVVEIEASPRSANSNVPPSLSATHIGCGFHAKAEA